VPRGESTTYEVWILYSNGRWAQAEDGDNGGIFPKKQRALAVAASKASGGEVVETIVIERNVIAAWNGPRISEKFRIMSDQSKRESQDSKKEEKHGAEAKVHGSGQEAGDVPPAGPSDQR
jgi:hypothetical protein